MTRILAIYPAVVAALLVILPILAPRSGPLALVTILSAHLALAAIVLVPVAVVRRGAALRASLAILGAVAIVRFGGEWFSFPPNVDTSDSLVQAVSWNLERGARSGADTVGGLSGLDSDIVALQELGPEHVGAIEGSMTLAERFPERALYPDTTVLGMGLLSRWPIVRAAHDLDPSVLEAVVDVDGRLITVFSVHPLAGPISMAGPVPIGYDGRRRDGDVARIRERVHAAIARGETVLVLGDFNLSPNEPAYGEMVGGLHDAHAEVGQGPGWTWRPSRFEWTGLGLLRIDHALSSPNLRPVSVSEHCGRLGDHCILEASFSLADADGLFEVEFPADGDIAALPVSVTDRTGLVTSVEAMLGGAGEPPIDHHPDRRNALVVSWLGGMCDHRVRMAIVPVGSMIRIAIKTDRANGCLLAGMGRAVVLDLHEPVDPTIVSVEEVP